MNRKTKNLADRFKTAAKSYDVQLKMTGAIIAMNTIMMLSFITTPDHTISQWDRFAQAMHYMTMPFILTATTIICILRKKKSLYRYFITATQLFAVAAGTCFLYAIVTRTEASMFLGFFMTSSCIIGMGLIAPLAYITKNDKNRD